MFSNEMKGANGHIGEQGKVFLRKSGIYSSLRKSEGGKVRNIATEKFHREGTGPMLAEACKA